MKILYRLFLVLFLFCFIPEAEAQKKNGIRPYTVATAYENLKKIIRLFRLSKQLIQKK